MIIFDIRGSYDKNNARAKRKPRLRSFWYKQRLYMRAVLARYLRRGRNRYAAYKAARYLPACGQSIFTLCVSDKKRCLRTLSGLHKHLLGFLSFCRIKTDYAWASGLASSFTIAANALLTIYSLPSAGDELYLIEKLEYVICVSTEAFKENWTYSQEVASLALSSTSKTKRYVFPPSKVTLRDTRPNSTSSPYSSVPSTIK